MPSCDWGYAPNCQCSECRENREYKTKNKTSNPAKLTCLLCDSLGTHFRHSRYWFCDTHYIYRKQEDAEERAQAEARRRAKLLREEQERQRIKARRQAEIQAKLEAKKLAKERAEIDSIRSFLVKKHKIRYGRFIEYRRLDALSIQLYMQEWEIIHHMNRLDVSSKGTSELLDCKKLELEYTKAQRLIHQCVSIHPHVRLLQKEFNLPRDMAMELTKFLGKVEYYDWYDRINHGFKLGKCKYKIKSLSCNLSESSSVGLFQFNKDLSTRHLYHCGYIFSERFRDRCFVRLIVFPLSLLTNFIHSI